jgi:5-methylcytosine-specific restriction endonuclease McrA
MRWKCTCCKKVINFPGLEYVEGKEEAIILCKRCERLEKWAAGIAYRAPCRTKNVNAVGLLGKIEMYRGKCWICEKKFEEFDHVKPVARGGVSILCNLRPICRSCNVYKGKEWNTDFMDEMLWGKHLH